MNRKVKLEKLEREFSARHTGEPEIKVLNFEGEVIGLYTREEFQALYPNENGLVLWRESENIGTVKH